MVAFKEILASNAKINDANAPRVSVFAGATSGIGKLTLQALVATGASLRIYLVGRASAASRTQAWIAELQATNPKAEIIWTEGEISLLAEVKRISELIKAKESSVDLLFLTAGYAPFGGRSDTAEGIEVTQSLEYYSRILFAQHLLPLLHASKTGGRVISVLGGGLEWFTPDLDNLDLKKPGTFGAHKGQILYGTMNTMVLDKLAHDNPGVTFMHSWPGWVSTGNVDRGNYAPGSLMDWITSLLLAPIIRTFAMSNETSAQRNLFECTSAAFGGRGVPWTGKPGVNTLGKEEDGMFLVNYKADCTPNAKVIPGMREKAQARMWEHTQEVLRPYL